MFVYSRFLKQKLARKSLFDFGIFFIHDIVVSFKNHIGIILEILLEMITKNG